MPDDSYSDDELDRYFNNPEYRREKASESVPDDDAAFSSSSSTMSRSQQIKQAARVVGTLAALMLIGVIGLGLFMYSLSASGKTPSVREIENPTVNLATVAYTADGKVLARYAHQNRSWLPYDSISTHITNALVATEDHRFREHWSMDLFRTASAVIRTIGAKTIGVGEVEGGSTITQQLARNLYDKQIGRETTIRRKVKEMMTAVELERRYTKREIIEMYLNTVGFGSNAFGVEAAAQTFFGVSAQNVSVLQAATLAGMLKAVSLYNPVRHPERAKQRRNIVLSQMVKRGHLTEKFYEKHKDDPVEATYNSAEITASRAPYFAEHVRLWLDEWGKKTGHNIYTEGLTVYTTVDSKMQEMARAAVDKQMKGLQAAVDYEWSDKGRGYPKMTDELGPYLEKRGSYEPFSYYWKTKDKEVKAFIRATSRYKQLAEKQGEDEALQTLRDDEAFIDSLRKAKTRLGAGMVAVNPNNGYVRAWVGGRNLKVDRYDHVSIARRQPGSTFKPFTYTAAIDNGYSPYYTLVDSSFCHFNPEAKEGNKEWCPENAVEFTNQPMTLSQGLAQSKNSITGQLILEIGPGQTAFYARRMGIRESKLNPVPSLALGTSPVTLLEMVGAYSTLANDGLYNKPTSVTRIEDRYGNVLYQDRDAPGEAVSEETARTVVDMMRGVINQGTGRRINWQWGLNEYDLAGKTGTTQKGADTWFMLMHPQLVTGAWVGFNDQRVRFRTSFWGQGAHSALFLVGDFFQRLAESDSISISKDARFPLPQSGAATDTTRAPSDGGDTGGDDDGGIGW
jgi:penicillin-binding protein 1A